MKINKWFPLVLSLSLTFSAAACSTKQKAITQSKDSRRLGEAYLVKGDYSGALKYFQEAEAMYAEDYLLQDDLGKTYVAKGRYDLAIEHFKKSLEIKPDFAPGKNNLGSAYLLAEQWDNAIAIFKELNENLLYATPHYPLYNLGWAYYNKHDYRTAIDYFNKSLKQKHGFVLALRGLGLTYQKMGNLQQAIEYFEKATQKSPEFAELFFDKGNAYRENRQYDKAIQAFNEVISLRPDSEIADMAKNEIKNIEELSK